jgi:DNA-binding PadR family transcriptional regulator
MEKIILGMLMMRGLTIYEMKIFIDNNLAAMCSNSSGSIHTAINKMLDKNLISYKKIDRKKIYYITAEGREIFNSWITEPMDCIKAKNMELSKMFFFGLSDPMKRKELILEYIKGLKKEYSKLKSTYERTTFEVEDIISYGTKVVGDNEWNEEGIKKNMFLGKLEDTILDVYKYQRATLDFGIEALEFQIEWYSKYLEKV